MKSIGTLALAACLVSFVAQDAHAACTLKYYGGPVVSNPKVVVVFWGGSVGAQTRTNITAFYTAIVNSPYIDWLSEYNTVGLNGQDGLAGSNQGISRGSVYGTYTIAPVQCGGTANCSLTDAQIQTELGAQIAAGALPAPTTGCDGQNDTIYALHFASNVSISYGGSASCVQFCYYHSSGTANGKAIAYTVNPDVTVGSCAGGCGADSVPFNNQTAVASAALFNAITDSGISTTTATIGRPLGWYADGSCGEIAGICNAQQGTITVGSSTWTVQKQWSNAMASCIVTRSSLPAICTAAGAPAGCRSCACADNGQGASGQVGCSGATPRCDATAGDTTYGQCVAAGTAGTAGGGGAGGATGTGGSSGGVGGRGGASSGSGTGGSAGGSAGTTGAGGTSGTTGAGGATGSGGSGGGGGASGKTEGTEGGPCYGNGTCNTGLTCLSQLCVMAPKSSGGCGCALGGQSDARALALVGLAFGLALTAGRRRRRR